MPTTYPTSARAWRDTPAAPTEVAEGVDVGQYPHFLVFYREGPNLYRLPPRLEHVAREIELSLLLHLHLPDQRMRMPREDLRLLPVGFHRVLVLAELVPRAGGAASHQAGPAGQCRGMLPQERRDVK